MLNANGRVVEISTANHTKIECAYRKYHVKNYFISKVDAPKLEMLVPNKNEGHSLKPVVRLGGSINKNIMQFQTQHHKIILEHIQIIFI